MDDETQEFPDEVTLYMCPECGGQATYADKDGTLLCLRGFNHKGRARVVQCVPVQYQRAQ